ncbi:hypothetical protein, partial [Pseudomonas viridiflava]
SIEWLARFSELDIGTLETLFEIAAQFGDRSDLQKIIAERCKNIMSDWPEPTADEYIERKRIFWLVRAFYFIKDTCDIYWNWLKSDRDIVFSLNVHSGRFN